MACEQRHHVLALLYKDTFHIIRVNDAGIPHLVVQGLPEVVQDDLITCLQLSDIPKEVRAVPAPVSGDDTVGVDAANGHTGLPQHGGALCHVVP